MPPLQNWKSDELPAMYFILLLVEPADYYDSAITKIIQVRIFPARARQEASDR
jgi:hypothetical protein